MAGGTVMYSAVYGRIGDGVAASAAAGVFSNVEQLANIAVRALSHACGVMVGMALGAGERDRRASLRQALPHRHAADGAGVRASRHPAALRANRLHFSRLDGNGAHGAGDDLYTLGGTWLNALNTVIIVSITAHGRRCACSRGH